MCMDSFTAGMLNQLKPTMDDNNEPLPNAGDDNTCSDFAVTANV